VHRHSRKLSEARGILGGVFLEEPDPGVRAALTVARDEIDRAAGLLAELSPRISEEERRRRLEEWDRVA
jgi:hypothetical protein